MICQIYNCQECGIDFSTKFECWEHKNIHSGECPFKCAFCKDFFPTVRDYIRHVLDHDIQAVKVAISSFDSSKIFKNVVHILSIQNKKELTPVACRPSEHSLIVGGTRSENGNEEILKVENKEEEKNNIAEFFHEISVHKETKKDYQCLQCNLKFKSIKKYRQHNKALHNFLCKNCNNRYSTSEKLVKHVCFISSDGEPFKCSCSKTFTKPFEFKTHIGSNPYSCCTCTMQFSRISNLIRHIRTHTKQKPYICKQCGRGFAQSANLRNHVSVHLGVKAVKCDECNFACKTMSGLLKHKKKHKDGYMKHANYIDKRKTSTSTSTCPVCKKEFRFKRNVGMHMKTHKRKESLCQECGKVFDTKSKLTTHCKACHGIPSVCQSCGKTFASSVLLAAHEKIHVSGKTFSCNKCCKTFSIKNYLVQHMKTHSKEKQFSCKKCGKLFKVAVSLKYHSKICVNVNVTM